MVKLFRREPGFYAKLLSLALPILFQNLITNSLGLVDTFMVGTMGQGPLAGVTLANIPVFVVQLMMFGIQSGSSVLISQYRGKGDLRAINRVMGIGMYAAGAIGLAFALVMGFLPEQFMGLFGNDRLVVATAARYARIVGWSYFFDSFVQVYIGVHRAMGDPNRGLIILGVSMASNTFLNWVFIFGNLGAPRLAEQGAALATLLARVLSCSIAVAWAVLDKKFKLDPALLFRPGGEMVRRFVRFSTPVMCNETFWGLGTSLFPTIMGHMDGSEDILAAYAIAGNITNLCTVGVFAISGTAAILIGQAIGSGRKDEVYSLGALLNVLAFLFGLGAGLVFLGVLYFVVAPFLYPLFDLTAAAQEICTMMLTIMFCMMPLRSLECTNIVGVLRGGGDVRMATLIDLTPLWVVALPLAVLSGLVFQLGILWVYLSMMSENMVKAVLSTRRFLSGRWINDVTIPAQQEAGA